MTSIFHDVRTQPSLLQVLTVSSDRFIFGTFWCNVSAFMDDAAIVATIWILGACSVDRLLCIVKPFRWVTFKSCDHAKAGGVFIVALFWSLRLMIPVGTKLW